MSIDEVSRRPDDWMDAVDARDRIDDVRAAMASWCLPAAQAAQLRALLDDHARLAVERDAALENTRTMVAALDDLASANAERDRLAAALAEVREAVEEIASHGEREPGPRRGMGHDLRAVLVATPADLAAAHDARVRAEALREAAAAVRMERDWHMDIHAECEAWLRSRADAEAERIGGGR